MKLLPTSALPLPLAACAATTRSADCLYATEMEYGLMTKRDSCTQPPTNAVRCLNCRSGER